MRRHPMAPDNVVRISVATSGTDFTAYRCTRVRSTTTKCTRGRGCNGHPAFPTPSLGGRFINASGASRRGIVKAYPKLAARSNPWFGPELEFPPAYLAPSILESEDAPSF